MNAKPIESKFAAMGARIKVREIPSRWRNGVRTWIEPRDFAVDKRQTAEHYRAGRPAFALRASARRANSQTKVWRSIPRKNSGHAQAPQVAEAD